MLLPKPTVRKVPAGQEKLKLYLTKLIIEAVEIPLSADGVELKQFFTELFAAKLNNVRLVTLLWSQNRQSGYDSMIKYQTSAGLFVSHDVEASTLWANNSASIL